MPCKKLLCRCSYDIYACWPGVIATNTAAVETCLLVECCCKMGTWWTVATQSACRSSFWNSILHLWWHCASLADIPAGVVSHYQSCLLVWCLLLALLVCVVSYYQQCLLVWGLTIDHACLCGVSIKAMHSSVVLHYQPCLLMWCIVIRHAFWCGTSLSAMPMCVVAHYRTCLLSSSVVPHCRLCLLVCWLTKGHACWCSIAKTPMSVVMVPHYRPCLLVRCQCNQHLTSQMQMEEGWLLVR